MKKFLLDKHTVDSACINSLPHNAAFWCSKDIHSCGKHCEKRRNCLKQAISPFLTMFSTLCGTYFSFQMHFNPFPNDKF